eukprot:2220988-Rhodomonas_salina.3
MEMNNGLRNHAQQSKDPHFRTTVLRASGARKQWARTIRLSVSAIAAKNQSAGVLVSFCNVEFRAAVIHFWAVIRQQLSARPPGLHRLDSGPTGVLFPAPR